MSQLTLIKNRPIEMLVIGIQMWKVVFERKIMAHLVGGGGGGGGGG